MPGSTELPSAMELARRSDRHFPGESSAYREARTALLAEEIELRRKIESVAAQRRKLPPGGVVPEDYVFQGAHGPASLSSLFGRHDTLVTYNWMFGPQRERSCPMCSSLLSAFDGEMPDILQRVAFAVIARSPVAKMLAYAKERGWRHLPLYSSQGTRFNQFYAFEDPDANEDLPAFNVFHREGNVIRHFWGDEMNMATADPDQDPRGAPDLMPIWNILDHTPAGRARDWYPSLDYPAAA